ncbi:hypothetical protein TNCV_3739631 [Trichonephila clavipes]|nr:hypothetical protein TNCV_3739631 [Trichonephila clavipes]
MNVYFDYEAQDDPIEDPNLKYKAEFYFFTLDKAINALKSSGILPLCHAAKLLVTTKLNIIGNRNAKRSSIPYCCIWALTLMGLDRSVCPDWWTWKEKVGGTRQDGFSGKKNVHDRCDAIRST